MWCKACGRETNNDICELCGIKTEDEKPYEVYWCDNCKVPIIKASNSVDKSICTICGLETVYLAADLRPVFPEERLLIEIILGKPLEYKRKSVWASNNRYYINGREKVIAINLKDYNRYAPQWIIEQLEKYSAQNDYTEFDVNARNFVEANTTRLDYLKDESFEFIKNTASKYPNENIVISFSGGKDSTVTADLAVRALSDPSLVHIYGDTTLEFDSTKEYVDRFRKENPMAIIKVAKNKDQDFYKVCEDIGPPARMLRWCCSMFKTGPITRVLNNLYGDINILTFYGIRKCESVSRSKYNRIEDSADAVKIQKQKVASPIFFWKDIDIWLYILGEDIDFNDAYRLGYDRVGCWCCPNNNDRAIFLSNIYMMELSNKWRDFLIRFAKSIGKPDPEVYIDSGKWKARQGGNGVKASDDVKIKFTNCTTEDNAKIFQLNAPMEDDFINLFVPFGKLAPELGRKLLNETIILDIKTNIPIMSIQPYSTSDYDNSVKIKVFNVAKPEGLLTMAGYQVRKFNACRRCLKCESLCKFGAITINRDGYNISEKKCVRCKMCVTAKYLEGGCLMDKYLKTKDV